MYGPMDAKKKSLDELEEYATGQLQGEMHKKYGPQEEAAPEVEAVPGVEAEGEGMPMEAEGMSADNAELRQLLASLTEEDKAALMEALKSGA
jgi:hypothetical protein